MSREDAGKPTLLLATHNEGKRVEFAAMLPEFSLFSLLSFGLPLPEETGATYEENALIKARAAYAAKGGLVLADDSGLSIDALDGAPGLYSARFAGIDADYDDKIAAIWHALEGIPPAQWTAAFHCVLALILPNGEEHLFKGSVEGLILPEQRGFNGFGFDPIFYLPALQKTTGEMAPALKNALSHRGRAVRKLRIFLMSWLAREGRHV